MPNNLKFLPNYLKNIMLLLDFNRLNCYNF